MGSSFSVTFHLVSFFVELGRGLVRACFLYHFLTAAIRTPLLLSGTELVGWMYVCGAQYGRKHLVMFAIKKRRLCIGIFVYYLYYISPSHIISHIVYLSRYAPSIFFFFFLLYRLLGCLGSFCVGIVRWFVGRKMWRVGVLSLFTLHFSVYFCFSFLFFTLLYFARVVN